MPLYGEHLEDEEAPEDILLFRNWFSWRCPIRFHIKVHLTLSLHFISPWSFCNPTFNYRHLLMWQPCAFSLSVWLKLDKWGPALLSAHRLEWRERKRQCLYRNYAPGCRDHPHGQCKQPQEGWGNGRKFITGSQLVCLASSLQWLLPLDLYFLKGQMSDLCFLGRVSQGLSECQTNLKHPYLCLYTVTFHRCGWGEGAPTSCAIKNSHIIFDVSQS